MYKTDSLIIDNEKIKLFDELNKILQEQKVIDIASGYFNIAGFQLIEDSLSDAESFRLLIGKAQIIEDKPEDIFQPEIEYKQNIRKDLEDEEFEKDRKETVIKLLEFLKRKDVEVRIYTKGFFHGKAYIFNKLAIIGSSNFTYSGFTSNTELNAVLDEAHSRYIKEEWFKKIWEESDNFKEDIIKILDESKFGTKEYFPYQIFIKSLYELQKDAILFEYEKP